MWYPLLLFSTIFLTHARFEMQILYSYRNKRRFWKRGGECDAAVRVYSGSDRNKYVSNQISIERYRASPTLTVLMNLGSSDTSDVLVSGTVYCEMRPRKSSVLKDNAVTKITIELPVRVSVSLSFFAFLVPIYVHWMLVLIAETVYTSSVAAAARCTPQCLEPAWVDSLVRAPPTTQFELIWLRDQTPRERPFGSVVSCTGQPEVRPLLHTEPRSIQILRFSWLSQGCYWRLWVRYLGGCNTEWSISQLMLVIFKNNNNF